MPIFKKIGFSKLFLAFITLFYLTNNVTFSIFNSYFALIPFNITSSFELWRLISYPLTLNSLESYVLTAVSFYFFSSKIERLFSKNVFPLTLLLIIVLYGLVTSLIFYNSKANFSGLEGISMFLLTLYSFLNIKKRIYINNFFNFSMSFVSSSIMLTWMCFKYLNIVNFGGNVLMDIIYPLAFGLVSGLIFFIRILFIESNYKPAPDENVIRGLSFPKQTELTPAIISNYNSKRVKELLDTLNSDSLDDDPQIKEDELNRILDKITDEGKDSLTEFENKFLEEYSKSID